ncbi:MAG TPA: tautomerase family protein [Chthoniobacterales bacterium]
MPFVQISLLRGKPAAYTTALSEAVHQALVEEFKIPAADKFQVIREVDPGDLVFPQEYFGIPHSPEIVYIQITAKEGRTVDIKQRLYARIASLIHTKTGLSQDDVFIVLTEVKAENWSFGRGQAQMAPQA